MALFTRQHKTSTQRIYEGQILNLRVDLLKRPDGASCKREVIEHNGGVVIVCQPETDKVILIKQYRYALDQDLLELPAGRLEPGEQPLPAAQRELIEETGYQAKHWKELPSLVTAPGFCNEILYLFRATDLAFVGRHLDDDEEIEVITLPIKEAWDMVLKGRIGDAKTVAGLALVR